MIKARLIIEVMGWPKEALKDVLKNVVKSLNERENIEVLKEEFSKERKVGKKIWRLFVEIEANFKEFKDLIGAIIDFGPINVEIISSDKITLDLVDIQDISSDFVYKMQIINEKLKNLLAENIMLKNKENNDLKLKKG